MRNALPLLRFMRLRHCHVSVLDKFIVRVVACARCCPLRAKECPRRAVTVYTYPCVMRGEGPYVLGRTQQHALRTVSCAQQLAQACTAMWHRMPATPRPLLLEHGGNDGFRFASSTARRRARLPRLFASFHAGCFHADFWFALAGGSEGETLYAPLDALDCGTPLVACGTILLHEPETADGASQGFAQLWRHTDATVAHRSRLRHCAQQPRLPRRLARRAQLEHVVRRHACGVGGDKRRVVCTLLRGPLCYRARDARARRYRLRRPTALYAPVFAPVAAKIALAARCAAALALKPDLRFGDAPALLLQPLPRDFDLAVLTATELEGALPPSAPTSFANLLFWPDASRHEAQRSRSVARGVFRRGADASARRCRTGAKYRVCAWFRGSSAD